MLNDDKEQGRTQDFLKEVARAEIFLYSDPVPLGSFSRYTGIFRDVHKKLTHLFYNFHGTKRCKDEFADTER